MILKLLIVINCSLAFGWHSKFIVDFSTNLIGAKHSVILTCANSSELFETATELFEKLQFVRFVNIMRSSQSNLKEILTRYLAVRTCVVLELSCTNAALILKEASLHAYFNTSFQWLLLDDDNVGLIKFSNSTQKIGINSQVSYANQTANNQYNIYDLYSKGQHLKSPLIATYYGTWSNDAGLEISIRLEDVQGRRYRDNFQGLTLRGVVVLDRNIINISQTETFLSNPIKTNGITQHTKYHYTLVRILQQRFNFTVDYRIAQGWSGRLPGLPQFRIGLLGIVQRNEADIAASGSFNRINRHADLDIIHQSWKYETAFIYRITADLKKSNRGDFLMPFEKMVWTLSLIAVIVVALVWKISTVLQRSWKKPEHTEEDSQNIVINSIGVLCQQGLQKTSDVTAIRLIAFALLIFSLLMYNFYTSSVVGGLLSTNAKGPENLAELLDSPLIPSFEDVPNHKVIFRETTSKLVKKLYETKVRPYRSPNMLPAYTNIKETIPFLRTGRYAYHCELIHAYPEIANHFEANEICDLRTALGLYENKSDKILNMIVTKRSSYSELFRIGLHRAREIGVINRELKAHRSEKPICQSGSTVLPVTFNSVINAFVILAVAGILSVIMLLLEIILAKLNSRL